MTMPKAPPNSLLSDHLIRFPEWYVEGVLDPETHYRLVENAFEYAREAGCRPKDIYRKLKDTCNTEAEYTFVRELAKHRGKVEEFSGLYYTTDMDPAILDRLRGLTGALVRNFVPVKLLSQGRFFDMIVDGEDFDDYPVLIINDLFRVGPVSDALRRSISSIIIDRYQLGRQTCFGKILSMNLIMEKYGEDVVQLISENFLEVEK